MAGPNGENILECELKLMLDKAEYFRIDSFRKNNEVSQAVQINYYFDTADFWFDRNDLSIRIREKGSTYLLTFKVTDLQRSSAKIRVAQEYNYSLDYPAFCQLLQSVWPGMKMQSLGLHPALDAYKEQLAKVEYLGKLVTKRAKFKPSKELPRIELDQNLYLDFVDWELECEVSYSEEADQLEQWLMDLGIQLVRAKRGKQGRFVDRLQEVLRSSFTLCRRYQRRGLFNTRHYRQWCKYRHSR
ncbi:MAG: CYTH domain-containing protein [Bacillota bacterium]|jgi:uncharacterized protein YjbK